MGHEGQKLDLLCILNHLLVVLINLFCQLNFLLLSMGRGLFCVVVVRLSFVGYYFLSNVNMGLVYTWMFLINLLHSDYFDNQNRVGNVVSYLFVIDLYRFLLHIYILILVIFCFLQDRI